MKARDSQIAKSPHPLHGARQSHDVNGDLMIIMMMTMTMVGDHGAASHFVQRHGAMTSVEATNNADATALRDRRMEEAARGMGYPRSRQGRGVMITQLLVPHGVCGIYICMYK